MTGRRAGAAVVISLLIVLSATPAAAHTTGGPPASNYRTELTGVQPPTTGVVVSLAADHEQLELRVSGPHSVTVLGYQGEPYLRIDARGVSENERSPAIGANRKRIPTASPGRATGSMRWRRVSHRPIARWHDHRAHWMGGITPGVVRRDPDHQHVVVRWSIPLRIDGHPARIRGRLLWTPPAPAWPWWAAAVIIAGAVVTVAARPRFARASLATALIVMAGTETVHLWSGWPYATGSTVGRLGDAIPSIVAIAACLAALLWLLRTTPWRCAPALILAGLFVFVSGGVADLSSLSHAFVPSRVSAELARALIALALGLGGGTAIAGGLQLRASRPSS
ncbi:MAG: hypothetical protein ABIP21_10160 [Acidimicrobiia bacterium]